LFREIQQFANENKSDSTNEKNFVASQSPAWENISPLLPDFYQTCTESINSYFAVARTKQWLRALSLKNQNAKNVFFIIYIVYQF
jgi:hypothetical protein